MARAGRGHADPRRAAPGKRHWQVRTNTAARGRSARIVIAEPDFAVIDAGYVPR